MLIVNFYPITYNYLKLFDINLLLTSRILFFTYSKQDYFKLFHKNIG